MKILMKVKSGRAFCFLKVVLTFKLNLSVQLVELTLNEYQLIADDSFRR